MKIKISSFHLLWPFLLWLFIFRDFFTGRALFIHDTFELYANIKLFLNSLQSGVYPFWDPYHLWGAPFTMRLLQFGEFNPFLYVIVILNTLGLSFFHAFTCYLALYYFIGLLGFYHLAKSLFKDSFLAYVGYLLLLFSSLGMNIFAQIQLLYIFVPAVWFFYFFIEFFRYWRRADLLGLTFAFMIILTTYVPFYFVTIFVFFLLLFAMIYFKEFKTALKGLINFCRLHTLTVFLCTLALGVSLTIPILVYQESLGEDCIIPSRHADSTRALDQSLTMDYSEIKGGGLGVRMSFLDLLSDLTQIDFRNDGFVYFPFFSFIILLLSFLTKISKRALLFLFLSFIIFLISLGEGAAFHRFLYDHIFFFRLFRNLYFFAPLLICVVVLLLLEQLRLMSERKIIFAQRPAMLMGAVTGLHAVFFVFLIRQEAVIISSYITLAVSLLFFILYFSKKNIFKKHFFTAALFFLILFQPLEVFSHFCKNSADFHSEIIEKSLRQDTVRPHFSFVRPKQYARNYVNGDSEKDPKFYLDWSSIAMQDSPGFITYHHGYPTRWSYFLSQHIPEEAYREYVEHKFILYDNVEFIKEDALNLEDEADRLKNNKGIAAVFTNNVPKVQDNKEAGRERLVVDCDSELLEVKHFNVNNITIKTHLPSKKFLVYNDSFHQLWQVSVNGKKEKLYRANMAFKGVWLPAGESVVSFSYHPKGGDVLYLFVSAFFVFWGVLWVTVWNREKRGVGSA